MLNRVNKIYSSNQKSFDSKNRCSITLLTKKKFSLIPLSLSQPKNISVSPFLPPRIRLCPLFHILLQFHFFCFLLIFTQAKSAIMVFVWDRNTSRLLIIAISFFPILDVRSPLRVPLFSFPFSKIQRKNPTRLCLI